MKITVLAIGKLRGAEAEWCAEYQKRLKGEIIIKELTVSKSLPPSEAQKAEAELLLKTLPPRSHVVLLDERGKDLTSRDLAATLQGWQQRGIEQLVFLIGGADGVTDKVRNQAAFILSFGRATWPHRLVRVMLLEQIYRARQISIGHPYHRD